MISYSLSVRRSLLVKASKMNAIAIWLLHVLFHLDGGFPPTFLRGVLTLRSQLPLKEYTYKTD